MARRRWQARLSSQALASKLASCCSEVATARAHRLGSSDGDGEADVEPATKKWMASERMPWHGEQASTGNGKQIGWSRIRAVGSFCKSTAETEIPWPHCWYVLHQHERTTGSGFGPDLVSRWDSNP